MPLPGSISLVSSGTGGNRMTEREQLEGAIAALESQRAVLGDAVVDTSLAALRARLDRLGRAEQQLKPVTVLFTDVVESTRLSRQLDPEDIHAIMDSMLHGARRGAIAAGARRLEPGPCRADGAGESAGRRRPGDLSWQRDGSSRDHDDVGSAPPDAGRLAARRAVSAMGQRHL